MSKQTKRLKHKIKCLKAQAKMYKRLCREYAAAATLVLTTDGTLNEDGFFDLAKELADFARRQSNPLRV